MTKRNWTVKQVTRRDFTADEIRKALIDNNHQLTPAARDLTKLNRGRVSRQLLRYWVNTEDFDDINSPHFEADQLMAKVRAQNTNRQLRREVRNLTARIRTQDEWEESILESVEQTLVTGGLPLVQYNPEKGGGSIGCTVELLVSDLQIGKLTGDYNTNVAIKRIKELGETACLAIEQKLDSGYYIDRIIISFLGDMIESDEKHADSARGCDSSTAEQMANCTEALFKFLIAPLAEYSQRVDCIGIVGNHDWNGNGLRSFKAGRTQLSYPIYKALELVCKTSVPHVSWEIPDGVFHIDNIYGQRVLYEHGVGVAVTEESMRKRKHQRGEQIGAHIFYFRMGDKHNVSTFNNSQYVVNGAFFGGGSSGLEYSEVAGYHSQPGQWMGFHCQREDERTTLFDTLVVQLGHIKDDKDKQ